jgi:hypothetical protein
LCQNGKITMVVTKCSTHEKHVLVLWYYKEEGGGHFFPSLGCANVIALKQICDSKLVPFAPTAYIV